MMEKLNTIWASWLKVFISAILSAYLALLTQGQQLFQWDLQLLQTLFTSGFVSCIPIIINYLNPSDPRYGAK